jgi:hypothetical protein
VKHRSNWVTWLVLLALGSSAPLEAQRFAYVASDGCGNIELYGWSEDRTEVIVIRANREKLGLHVGANTVSIVSDQPDLEVVVDIYARTQDRLHDYYCNDVRLPEDESPIDKVRAISGTLLITLGERGKADPEQRKREGKPPFAYEATVTLREVVFRRPDGRSVSPHTPITLKALVGFVYG